MLPPLPWHHVGNQVPGDPGVVLLYLLYGVAKLMDGDVILYPAGQFHHSELAPS
jgi:hypothetical protein